MQNVHGKDHYGPQKRYLPVSYKMCIFFIRNKCSARFLYVYRISPTHFALRPSILVIIRGLVTTYSIFGHEQTTRRDRKILSSLVEVMEVSYKGDDFHISDKNLTEEDQVEVNAFGSPCAAQDIARGGEVLVATDQNVVRVV